ncbi:MAG: methyltransferase domain-containing protein [Parachlamydiaceae bacterium]
MTDSSPTSWKKVGKWYNDAVGESGHYYHQAIIIPNVLKCLNFDLKHPASLLDLACGQGVLSRHIPPHVSYMGIDAAAPLIAAAKHYRHPNSHHFLQADITKKFPLTCPPFTHGSIILALQNIENPLAVFKNAHDYLQIGAPFVVVLNHPCFRIPRQSSWKIDEQNKIQYRRIDRYMTSMKIPIQAHPSKGSQSTNTLSFHHPLCDYSRWLKESGFTIDLIDEWCSDKISEGGAARMENRSRQEIPLFMALLCRKI